MSPAPRASRTIFFSIHLSLGLALGAYFSLVGLTGSLLVFAPELSAATMPPPLTPRSQEAQLSLAATVDRLSAAYPDRVVSRLRWYPEAADRYRATLTSRRGDIDRIVFVDRATGAVLGHEPVWIRWTTELHYYLLAGPTGHKVNGAGAALLGVVTLAGLVLWWPGRGGLRTSMRLRVGNWRTLVFDAHRVLGALASVALLAISISGVYFAYPDLFRRAVGWAAPPASTTRAGATADFDAMRARAAAALPGGIVTALYPPTSPSAPVRFRVKLPGDRWDFGRSEVYLDRHTGDLLGTLNATTLTLPQRAAVLWMAPVHYGRFGGLVTRLAWVLLGLVPGTLFLSGCAMWWNRSLSRHWRRWRGQRNVARCIICLLASAAATVGCGPASADPDGGTPVLRVVSQWEPSSLEPGATGYIYTRMQVADTLVSADDQGRPVPGLARSWTESPDGLSWDFMLRTGVHFHDGTELDGPQTARSLNRARQRTGSLFRVPIADVVALPGGVRIRLTEPYSLLPALLAHSSAQVLAASSFQSDDSIQAVIGTGPYRITRMTMPQSFDVDLSPHWTGVVPEVRSAKYLAVGRAETRALLARSGQADLVFNLDALTVERFLRERPDRTLLASTPRTVILKLNAGHPFLRDVRAREALSLAIDREGIAHAILRDRRLAATQLLPPSMGDWHLPGPPALRTDRQRAAALLTNLGWRRGADGALVRGDQRFSLEMRVPSDRPELPVVAAALQAQLWLVGIEISIVVGNSADIPLMHHQGTLETGLAARNYATFNDPGATLAQDFGRDGGDWGAMGWADAAPVTAALVSLQRGAGDRAQELREAILRRLQAGLPVIPIAWYTQGVAVSSRVNGASLDPLERSYRLTDLRWAHGTRR